MRRNAPAPARVRWMVAVGLLLSVPVAVLALQNYGGSCVAVAVAGWLLIDESPAKWRLSGSLPTVVGKILVAGGAIGFIATLFALVLRT